MATRTDMTPEQAERWRFEITQAFAADGGSDWFTGHLFRLIDKADRINREMLRLGFPVQVDAYERWLVDPETLRTKEST